MGPIRKEGQWRVRIQPFFTDQIRALTYYIITKPPIVLPLHAMLIRIITWMFVIGIVYRLLNRYILPIFRVTSTATSHIRQMQEQMKKMQEQTNNNNATPGQPKPRVSKSNDGDYIDYEEVK